MSSPAETPPATSAAPAAKPPEVTRATEAKSVVEQTASFLESMRHAFNDGVNITSAKAEELLDTANTQLGEVQKYMGDTSAETLQAIEKELALLPATISALPQEIQTQAEGKISTLKRTSGTVLSSIRTTAGYAWNKVTSGVGWTFDKIADAATAAGEIFNDLWEKIKPHLGRLAGMPGLKYILGAEGLAAIQEWSGFNPATEKLKEDISARIPDDVAFVLNPLNPKKDIVAFNDKYNAFLRAKNLTAASYDQGTFIAEMITGKDLTFDNLIVVTPDGSKKELGMARILEAADKMIARAQEEAKNKSAPATTPPPATPAPSNPTA